MERLNVLLNKYHQFNSHKLIPKIWWLDLTLIIIQFTWSTIIQSGFQGRESIFWSPFCSCDLFFFYWPEWRCMECVSVCVRVCVCLRFPPDGVCQHPPPPPLFSPLPVIPARLNGRPLDWLSDEMMTLLWEAIPKWEISDEDYTPLSLPRHPPAIHCQLHRWWLICPRWITGSTHWFFCVLSKIFIYSCIHRVYPDSPRCLAFQTGGLGIKGIILPVPRQDEWPEVLFQKRVNKLSE